MPQTQTVNEHLQAVQTSLKNALDKQDAEAKRALGEASKHLDAAKAELKSQMNEDNALRKAEAQQTMDMLDAVSKEVKKALDETGTALQTRVRDMNAKIKAAFS